MVGQAGDQGSNIRVWLNLNTRPLLSDAKSPKNSPSEPPGTVFMKPATPPSGKCPQAPREQCPLVCKYNHFESDDLTIDAWELKCLDCGWRETIAYRSDELDPAETGPDFNPRQCPFCHRCDLAPGKEPCDGR